MTDAAFVLWRRRWRALGLALDKLLPWCFGVPSPPLADFSQRVLSAVTVPGTGKYTLTVEDKKLVVEGAQFVVRHVAEHLPFQLVATDLKPLLPGSASNLAVRAVGGEREYLGSFDLLFRVHARSGVWHAFDGAEVAFDVKLTGASQPIGVNSPTILGVIQHGRAVLEAARKQSGCRVGACRVVAYLFRRPPGTTLQGRSHSGAWALLAFDVQVLLAWDPRSSTAPRRLATLGTHVVGGSRVEPEALPRAPVLARPPRRDRWEDLEESAQRGWVTLLDFVAAFDLVGRGAAKHATGRASKRMQDAGHELKDSARGVGRPPKMARLCDLKRCYTELR